MKGQKVTHWRNSSFSDFIYNPKGGNSKRAFRREVVVKIIVNHYRSLKVNQIVRDRTDLFANEVGSFSIIDISFVVTNLAFQAIDSYDLNDKVAFNDCSSSAPI